MSVALNAVPPAGVGTIAERPADETSLAYQGWQVAAASAVGVFVSFASLLVYTFGIFYN